MRIGTIKGIDIKLHLSTLLIIGMVGFYAANFFLSLIPGASILEMVLVGIINGAIILVSILIHELAHSLYALKYGLKVSEIELYLFGGVSKIEQEPKTPKSELIISAIGPFSSFIIGLIFILLLLLPISLPNVLSVTFLYSGISNIGLAIFNFLPAFPIDGGRVLRAILWNKRGDMLSATKTASKVGEIFGYGLVAYGFLQSFLFGIIGGFWLVIMGFFLTSSAKNAYTQTLYSVSLSKIRATDISGLPHIAIPFETLINDAIRNYFMLYKRSYFPVIQAGRIIGIVHINDVKNVPYERRNEYIVGYVMRKISDFPIIEEDERGDNVLNKLNLMQTKPNIVVVKEKDKDTIVGFIGREEIAAALEFAKLGVVS